MRDTAGAWGHVNRPSYLGTRVTPLAAAVTELGLFLPSAGLSSTQCFARLGQGDDPAWPLPAETRWELLLQGQTSEQIQGLRGPRPLPVPLSYLAP